MDAVVEKCLHCGKPITRAERGRPQRFCTDAHRKAYSRLNGQNKPKPHHDLKTQNLDFQPIDIVERICPEIRTHTPSWKRLNECTWKLTRGTVTAWVMNVAPNANHPRACSQSRQPGRQPDNARRSQVTSSADGQGTAG